MLDVSSRGRIDVVTCVLDVPNSIIVIDTDSATRITIGTNVVIPYNRTPAVDRKGTVG